jgi:hypothetical protein
MKEIEFSKTNALIMWAVRQDEGGTALPGLIAAADYVNHAIPTAREINRAITKGLRAGLLIVTDGRIKYSAQHTESIQDIITKPKKAYDSVIALYKFLSDREWKEICQDTYEVSDDDVKGAYDIYIQQLRKRRGTPNQAL